jgi:nitrite reductase/ring-hydroxylating ferredoxin subunit
MASDGSSKLAFAGYRTRGYGPDFDTPDLRLTQVGRGTPGGEYLRRFWHPVAYVRELSDVPIRLRILGEELVLFRDRSGSIGLLFLNCCHRGASLEFGIIEQHGIRCCYHGRIFAVDGRQLEIPGEPASEQIKRSFAQGAYQTHVFGGMIFAYMGPPEQTPPFPRYDIFDVPGTRLVPGSRLPFACNWVQIKDNAMDPAHTGILHAIPAPGQPFSPIFGTFPTMYFAETPVGLAWLAARRTGEDVLVRTMDLLMPNQHVLTSITGEGWSDPTYAPPWISIWTTPVDDENSINFVLNYGPQDERTTDEERRQQVNFGQQPDRPYAERQRVPGDYDVMVSQGAVAVHATEKLAKNDIGLGLFRKALRRGIDAVERGDDPPYLSRTEGEVRETYVNNQKIRLREGDGADESQQLQSVCKEVWEQALRLPPQRAHWGAALRDA